MSLSRTAILQLYDYVARHIPLDLDSEQEHLLNCSHSRALATQWITANASEQKQQWQRWLDRMCIECDCTLLLQLNTFATEQGAVEGMNMRRCSSCNALLALYQVSATPSAQTDTLIAWASQANVPAYLLTLNGEKPSGNWRIDVV